MRKLTAFALFLNASLLFAILHEISADAQGDDPPVATENGDTNGDGGRDLSDAIYLLSWLFQCGPEPVSRPG